MGKKISELDELLVVGDNDLLPIVTDVDGTLVTKKIKKSNVVSMDIDDLSDVDAAAPSDADGIFYNESTEEWEHGPQSGGGANLFVVGETPVETPDDIITNFSTEYVFAGSKIEVFQNRTRLSEGNDYTEDGDTNGITFVTAPPTGAAIRINYLKTALVAIGDSGRIYDEEPTGDVDSSNTAYDTAHTFIAGAIDVYVNNVHQTPTDDYVETDADTITFVTPPQTGDTLRVYYDRYLPSAGNASQLDGNTMLEVMSLLNPVGTIREFNVATNPGTLLGFGTWSLHGVGRTTVCIDSSDTDFDTIDETRGAKTHQLTEAEIAAHGHASGTLKTAVFVGASGSTNTNSVAAASTGAFTGSLTGATADAGSDTAHNNIQPSIVAYRWVRTA
jgi:baseplate structural protein gp10